MLYNVAARSKAMEPMKHPIWGKVIALMFEDQGMRAPKTFPMDLDLPKVQIAERFLGKLTPEEFETVVIGDQEDMRQIFARGPEADAEAAHEVLDELFMLIGG
jgi:hypothetical protein